MKLDINEGERPSLLTLGRRATGEVEGPIPAEYAADLEEASARVRPFDAEILFKAAVRLDEATPVRPPRPARRWAWMLAPLLIAAAALLVVRVPQDRAKGAEISSPATLEIQILQDGEVRDLAHAQPAGPGDRVQFEVMAGGRSGVVLISVDGLGHQSQFWPEAGDRPLAVTPQGRQLLDGSILLDDAPGPEAFLAFFDSPTVAAAQARADQAWRQGQLHGLQVLAGSDPSVALVLLPRRRAAIPQLEP